MTLFMWPAEGYAPVLAVENSATVVQMYSAAGLRTLLVRGGEDGAYLHTAPPATARRFGRAAGV